MVKAGEEITKGEEEYRIRLEDFTFDAVTLARRSILRDWAETS